MALFSCEPASSTAKRKSGTLIIQHTGCSWDSSACFFLRRSKFSLASGRTNAICLVSFYHSRDGYSCCGYLARYFHLLSLRRYGISVFYEPEVYPPRNEVLDEVILGEL